MSKITSGALPRVEFEKRILPNGLQLILHQDRKLPIVHVNQWFHVGSKNERPGRTGFAHLFEHIMFQGSLNARDEYFSYVERAGANLREGGVNGTTDFDRTNYFATVPSGNLEFLLWVESDRLATLADALTQEKLDNQREVVRNERRQSLENQPYGRAFQLLFENLHPAGHPYSWDVIGSHEDLVAASLDDVKEFFHRFYTPNNLSLTIAGDFDPDEAHRLVEKYFGDIPPGPVLERVTRWIPPAGSRRIVEAIDRVPQERTYMAWPAPPYFDEDQTALDFASMVLSDGLSSRLVRRLVYDEQLCSSVGCYNQSLEISGSFMAIATARPGVSLEHIEDIIVTELRRLATDGVPAEELERARTKWEFGFVSNLERIGGFGGKADLLNHYNTFLGEPGKLDEDILRYRSVTPEAVAAAAAKWVADAEPLLIRFRPETAAVAAAPTSALDRSVPPSHGEDRPVVLPAIHRERLSNGMDLFVHERHDLPKVHVSLVTRVGAWVDPPGKAGLAQLTASVLPTGAPGRDALAIEDAMGDLGGSISASAERECTIAGFDVLTRNLAPALEIFRDVVLHPTFPAEDFEREKALHLDGLVQQSSNPASVAGRLRPMLGFGADHPYGTPVSGLPASVGSMTREDCVAMHARWSPSESAIVFAGDVTVEDARRFALETFGEWNAAASVAGDVPEPRGAESGTVFLVDRAGAPQTIISQILPGPRRGEEDFHRFRMVDSVWGGGGFGTRLNLNIREDKGYSYGVFSSIAAHRSGGLWWASGAIQSDKTAEALVEFAKELRDLAGERPITDTELSDARVTRVRGYAQQFESLGRIASRIAGIWTLDLPITEMERELESILNATTEEVVETARRWARPEKAFYLLVGDLAIIREAAIRAGFERIVTMTAEGEES